MMAATYLTSSQLLHDTKPGCCPLCKSVLPTEGLQHTRDYGLVMRDGYVAQFSWLQAAVMRELFKEAERGFRLTRDKLINGIYDSTDAPLNAGQSVSVAIQHIRRKILPLGMGLISDNGIVNLVFTPPGYKPKARTK